MPKKHRPRVADFRISPMDSPIGTFLPDRLEWEVVAVNTTGMSDREGTEVHRFSHWTVPNIYVRIAPPRRAA